MSTRIFRFGFVLSPSEKRALESLAAKERIPAAAVVRRLVWKAAEDAQLVAVKSAGNSPVRDFSEV